MKVLVTGGAGFIGSHVVEKYLNEGFEITIVDDLSMGLKVNIPDSDKITFYERAITDTSFMQKLLIDNNFDYIFLLAAIASVVATIEHPTESHEVNQNANLNILEIIRKNNLTPKRIIFASSAAVYGNNPELPKTENSSVLPMTPYAIDKYATEKYVLAYSSLYNIPTVATRFFNVYGPRQNPKSPYSGVLSIISDSFLQSKKFTIFGDGLQTRDFVFVADVVNALALLAVNDDAIGNVYNVATGNETSILDVISMYEVINGMHLTIEHLEERNADIKHSVASIEKLRSLGFKNQYSVQEGLSIYWDSLSSSN